MTHTARINTLNQTQHSVHRTQRVYRHYFTPPHWWQLRQRWQAHQDMRGRT